MIVDSSATTGVPEALAAATSAENETGNELKSVMDQS